MTLRALIIEDEVDAQELLASILKEYCPFVAVMNTASSLLEARDALAASKYDLTFLDVQLGHELSLELLERYREAMGEIVFTTAYEEHAIPAIKAAAVDYLLKPMNPLEVKEAVEKVIVKSKGSDLGVGKRQTIQIHENEGVRVVSASDIIRVQAQRMYSLIYLKDGNRIITSKPLKEWESILNHDDFFRSHQSHLIHLQYVDKVSNGSQGKVVLKDGSEVPLSRRRKEEFKKALSK